MIDREDMLELTRRMTLSRNCLTRIAGAYMNGDRELEDTFNTRFLKLSPSERARNLALAKTIPFSRTNEQLKEHKFGNMRAGSFWSILMSIRECGLKNDALLEVFYEQLLNNFDGGSKEGAYIFLFHGAHDIPAKGRDGSYIHDGDEVYEFILCAAGGLQGQYEPAAPQFGFLFPAFVGRSPDEGRINVFDTDPACPESDMLRLLLS